MNQDATFKLLFKNEPRDTVKKKPGEEKKKIGTNIRQAAGERDGFVRAGAIRAGRKSRAGNTYTSNKTTWRNGFV